MIAPNIVVETIWEHDDEADWGSEYSRDWQKEEDRDDWQCWQSEVRATIIANGELITGSAYLGSTWEKFGDDPRESNPDISGYERQMTWEAIHDLPVLDVPNRQAAIEYVEADMQRAHDEQQKEHAEAAK